MNHEGERTNATPRGGASRSSDEVRESGRSEGGACSEAKYVGPTRNRRSLKDEAKPYCISRWEILEAYKKVKSNIARQPTLLALWERQRGKVFTMGAV